MSSPAKTDSTIAETIIQPNRPLGFRDFIEAWSYRSLLWSMTVRLVRTELADLHLGVIWMVARPLLMLAVFTMWRQLSGANMGVSIEYPVYLYSGLIMWFFFANAVQKTAGAVRRDAGLIRKVYFPRVLSPLSSTFSQFYGFAISMVPLVGLMIWFGTVPDWKLLLLPVLLFQCALLIFGLGCLFAALTVNSNDWDRALSLALYIGLFVSPVIFSPALLEESRGWWIYHLNPMSGTLLAFRATLSGEMVFPVWEWVYSCGFSIVAVLVGFYMFQRLERALLDRI